MTLAYRMKKRKARRFAKDFYCDAPITRDPTFTFKLRRNYKSEVEFRWRKVRAAAVDAVLRQDMLGTNLLKPTPISMVSGGQDKIKLFQDWFDRMLAVAVLENDGNWLLPMVEAAYNRGIERAQILTNNKALPTDRDTVIAALRQFAFVELQGIVEAVSQVAVRSVAEGLINERSKSVMARGITDAIQNVGIVRSRAMVDMIIVKSFNVASLDQFAAAGFFKVGLLSETVPAAKPLLHDAKKKKSIIQALLEEPDEVEVLTAGDDDVCPICEDISLGGPYFIEDAYDLIPAHPHCRCAFVPAEDARFAAVEHDAADYDPDQPRDPSGRWGEGGGAIGGSLRDPEQEHHSMMVRLHKEALEKARAAVKAAQAGEAFKHDEWNEEDHPRVPAGSPGGGEFEGNNSPGAAGKELAPGIKGEKKEDLKKKGLVTLMERQTQLNAAIAKETDPDKRQALRQELLKNMEVQHQLYTEKNNTKRQAEYAYKIDKLKGFHKLSSDYDAKSPATAKAPDPVATPKPAAAPPPVATPKPPAPEPFHQTKPTPKYSEPIGDLPQSHGSMTTEERAELRSYTGSGYRQLNSQMRTGAMTEDQYRSAQRINRALDKLPPYKGEVRRQAAVGEEVYKHYKTGMIVEERGFTSTSKRSNWAWQSGGTNYHIKSDTGRSIRHLSKHPNEDEVLFKSGTRFRVTKVDGKNIHMEEVPHVR